MLHVEPFWSLIGLEGLFASLEVPLGHEIHISRDAIENAHPEWSASQVDKEMTRRINVALHMIQRPLRKRIDARVTDRAFER